MAKTGAKFKTCNVAQAEAHNRRRKAYTEALKKKYGQTHYREDLAHLNMFWDNPDYQGRSVAQIKRQASEEAKAKTGRKMQEKASPVREACPPIKPDTKIEDFEYFRRWLAAKGIKVISIDLHHDEGHYDKDTNEWVPNHHAHIIVDWFNHETGKSVRLTPTDCKEMQTVLAESLGMERGTPKEDTGIEGLSATEFKLRKAKEELEGVKKEIVNIKDELDENKGKLKKVKDEVSSMSTKKAFKQKILGLFNQSSKDEEIRNLKEEITKTNKAKDQVNADLLQKLDEEARERQELEKGIGQLKKGIKEAAQKELEKLANTMFIPFMKEVWCTLNSISGENTPEPKDLVLLYESLTDRLQSTLNKTIPAMKSEASRAGSSSYQRNTIWPWIKRIWNAINEITGEHPVLPENLADVRNACSERLLHLRALTDQRVEDEKLKGIQEYQEKTAEPRYVRYANTISHLNTEMTTKDKTIAELHTKNGLVERLLETMGFSNPVVKDAYDAIYALSTTSSAKRFTPIQASIVDKALSLANDSSLRVGIAQWLLDQVWKAVNGSSTYSAWFRNNAYPETMTIANGENTRDNRSRRYQRGQG